MDARLRLAAATLALALSACERPPAAPPPRKAPAVAAAAERQGRRPITVPMPMPRPSALPVPASARAPQPKSAAALPAVTKPRQVPLVPPKARTYAPVLVGRQRALWPGVASPWTLAGLVEQESCVSLRSTRCWDPRAELRTSREYGFGLGQITVAYNCDGSVRFDKFAELRRQYASLQAWRWEDRYDAAYQLTAIVEMMRGIWRRVPPAATADDRWAFADSSYNGGIGSLLQDRRLCANARGCDATRWFGNVETHSLKSRRPQPAYGGQSWFSINRGHVRNVLEVRRARYRQFWE